MRAKFMTRPITLAEIRYTTQSVVSVCEYSSLYLGAVLLRINILSVRSWGGFMAEGGGGID